MNGHRLDGRLAGAVGRGGGHGRRAEQARRTELTKNNRWRRIVISLEVLYGFGALIAVVLFAYLVFALICAEEF
jgi:K+-transporting ATPase ATPase F chain